MFYFLNEGRKAEKETKCKAGVSKVPAGDHCRDGQKEQSRYRARKTILFLYTPGKRGCAGDDSYPTYTSFSAVVLGRDYGFCTKTAERFDCTELSCQLLLLTGYPLAANTLLTLAFDPICQSYLYREAFPSWNNSESFTLWNPLSCPSKTLFHFGLLTISFSFHPETGIPVWETGRASSLEGEGDSQTVILF